MSCLICHKGPTDGVSLFRVNPKGRPAIWACKHHLENFAAPVDPEVAEIVGIIEGKEPKP